MLIRKLGYEAAETTAIYAHTGKISEGQLVIHLFPIRLKCAQFHNLF